MQEAELSPWKVSCFFHTIWLPPSTAPCSRSLHFHCQVNYNVWIIPHGYDSVMSWKVKDAMYDRKRSHKSLRDLSFTSSTVPLSRCNTCGPFAGGHGQRVQVHCFAMKAMTKGEWTGLWKGKKRNSSNFHVSFRRHLVTHELPGYLLLEQAEIWV